MPEEQRFVLGIAYQAGPDPRIKRGIDGGRDWFSKAELERAAWSYMRSGCPQMNAFHTDGTEDCAEPVESFIWRWGDWDVGDGIVVKDGDWCLGAILSPRMWELHKAGKVNAFSPQGTARRRQVQKEGAMTVAKGAVDSVDDGEFTELVDATIPTMALVGQGANGIPRFLISKQEDGSAGLFDPAVVRDLLAKSEPEPAPEDTVTMTGSPAAIARLIHGAPVRQVAKAKYDAADLKRMAANHEAMPDESYPVADKADLTSAIRAVGRGGADHDAIRRHVIARAEALGATSEIPDNWNADGSLKGDVAKEMDMDDDLDPTTLLADTDGDAPGMDTDPGSPAWEEIDAATARKWTMILARAKAAIDLLADREMLEAASGDEDDADNAFDLQDACCAIDYAISVLAPFAVDEQAEADCCDDMQTVGKALADWDAAPLDTIEALGHVRKAGRVLSAGNEAAIRGAVDSLQKVLASLPAAPITEEGGQTVAKTANLEPDMPKPTLSEDATAESGQESAMGTAEPDPKPVAGVPVTAMAKADGEKTPMTVVYDQKGRLIGIVDPADVTPVSNSEADPGEAPDDTAAPEAAPDASDLTPAPAGEVGTPADAVPTDDDTVAKTTGNNDTTSEEVLKSIVDTRVAAKLAEYRTTQEQAVAKQADERAQLVELIEMLKGRVETLEEQPAEPRVFTNGQTPPRDLRGMDRGARSIDVLKAAELKKSLMASTNAVEQRDIVARMNGEARFAFDQLQSRG
jgi:hypothetical protein